MYWGFVTFGAARATLEKYELKRENQRELGVLTVDSVNKQKLILESGAGGEVVVVFCWGFLGGGGGGGLR